MCRWPGWLRPEFGRRQGDGPVQGLSKCSRPTSRAPRLARCSVWIWQSISWKGLAQGDLCQSAQGNLGRVSTAAEHGFAKKDLADRDPVQAADQIVVEPDLDGMRVPRKIECDIGLDHLGQQPGALVWPAWLGTGANHILEGQVDTDLVAAMAQRTA